LTATRYGSKSVCGRDFVSEGAVKIKLTVESQQLDKEELRHLIQAIRDCEQSSFPDKEIFIWVEAPELSAAEASNILASIKPAYRSGVITIKKC